MWIRDRLGSIRLGLLPVNYFSLSKDFHRCNMGTLRLRVSLKVPGKILSDWESVEWGLGHCRPRMWELSRCPSIPQPFLCGPCLCIIKDFV